MSPFKRIIGLLSIASVGLALLLTISIAAGSGDEYAALKFQLQTQCGLTTYAQITGTFNLAQMRPVFTAISLDTPAYLFGDYALGGRQDKVKLAIGRDGWALAAFTNTVGIEHLFDNAADYSFSAPEKAVSQVAAMVNVTTTAPGYFDFRYPQATGAFMHWIFIPVTGDATSTITLPVGNTYVDRGYIFFTAESNSNYWINGALIDQQLYVDHVYLRWGKLSADQLRVGQTNGLHIQSFNLFGNGFYGGVSTEYIGSTPVVTSGGSRRDFTLAYPAMLGAPIQIQQAFLPVIRR